MKLALFFIVVVNPMLPSTPAYGPNHDWAPLLAEYSVCATDSPTYFQAITCTMGAYENAVHPVSNA